MRRAPATARQAPKQHQTAKRVYDRLVGEYGFTGGETIRRFVRFLRDQGIEVYIPLTADWGEAVMKIAGVETVVRLFCLRMRVP